MNHKRIVIYSYRKVWNVEKKIYAFQNIRLPFPINPYELLEFMGVAFLMLAVGKVFPFWNHIPTVIRYVALPYGVTHCITKVRLDGKNPVKYFLGCAVYFLTVKGNCLQRMEKRTGKQSKEALSWKCGRGY